MTRGGTTAVRARSAGNLRRAVAVAVLGLGVAAGAAAITLLSMLLRAARAVGGSCADAALADQPCRSHPGTALLLAVACALACLLAVSWGAAVLGAPRPLFLAWPVVALTLGWNFLRDGFDSPMGEGISLGYVVGGVVFLVLGAAPLLLRLSAARDGHR